MSVTAGGLSVARLTTKGRPKNAHIVAAPSLRHMGIRPTKKGQSMQSEPVQIRRDSTGRPALFWRNWRRNNPGYWWTEGFSNGEYFQCSEAWRLKCTLIRPDAIPADAAALIREFETAGPPSEHCKVRPVLRLQRPKG